MHFCLWLLALVLWTGASADASATTPAPIPRSECVLALGSPVHSSCLAILRAGQVLAAMELDLLGPANRHDIGDWVRLLHMAEAHAGVVPQGRYGAGAITVFPASKRFKKWWSTARKHLPVRRWVGRRHHEHGHAHMAFLSSPFSSALVVSMDGGGGADGVGGVFLARRDPFELTLLGPVLPNIGTGYLLVASAFPHLARLATRSALPCWDRHFREPCRALPALLMPLSMMSATPAPGWGDTLYQALDANAGAVGPQKTFRGHVSRATPAEVADLAAAVQAAVEAKVLDALHACNISAHLPAVEGIAMVGGVALNVRLNTALQEALGKPVFVPAAPDDLGLPIGYGWSLEPPPAPPRSLAFLGPAVDHDGAAEVMRRLHLTSEPLRMATAAAALAQGLVLGVMVGPQEYGLQGLGHRVIVAAPHAHDRLWGVVPSNASFRRFTWVVRGGDVPALLLHNVTSPHATFTAALREPLRARYRDATWPNGHIVTRTVDGGVDPFMHRLLSEVAATGAPAVLLSTRWPRVPEAPHPNCLACHLRLMEDRPLDHVIADDRHITRSLRSPHPAPPPRPAIDLLGQPCETQQSCL